ncbi:MAG: hypothetical protein AAF447_07440 [Myxococcota bacterium]
MMDPIAHFRSLYEGLYDEPPIGLEASRIALAEARLGVALPDTLRGFHLALGGEEDLLGSHNRVRRPEEITLVDARLIFMEENQGGHVWAVSPGHGDPKVEVGTVEGSKVQSWHPDGTHLCAFLEVTVHLHTAWGGFPYGATHRDPDAILGRLKGGGWTRRVAHGGVHVFAQRSVLLWWNDGGDHVSANARDEEDVTWLVSEWGFDDPFA